MKAKFKVGQDIVFRDGTVARKGKIIGVRKRLLSYEYVVEHNAVITNTSIISQSRVYDIG